MAASCEGRRGPPPPAGRLPSPRIANPMGGAWLAWQPARVTAGLPGRPPAPPLAGGRRSESSCSRRLPAGRTPESQAAALSPRARGRRPREQRSIAAASACAAILYRRALIRSGLPPPLSLSLSLSLSPSLSHQSGLSLKEARQRALLSIGQRAFQLRAQEASPSRNPAPGRSRSVLARPDAKMLLDKRCTPFPVKSAPNPTRA